MTNYVYLFRIEYNTYELILYIYMLFFHYNFILGLLSDMRERERPVSNITRLTPRHEREVCGMSESLGY